MPVKLHELATRSESKQQEVDAMVMATAVDAKIRAVGSAVNEGATLNDALAEGASVRAEVLDSTPIAFEVDPKVMYPAMIKHILAVLNGQEQMTSSREAQYRTRAARLPQAVWDNALQPASGFAPGSPERVNRAEALEIARLWFTTLMKEKYGRVYLHILAGDYHFQL